MTYKHFRNLALVFGLALTLATTLLIYLGYRDPVEAMGQALFVLILVFDVLYFQKGGGWAALAASLIYVTALLVIGPKTGSAYIWASVILRVTMYGFTGLAGGEICARVKVALEDMQASDLADRVTGLFNKEHFYRLAGASVEMFERYQSPFSLLIFAFNQNDIKKVGGDKKTQAMASIAREIKAAIRTSDEAGRPSDESIAILLYNTEAANADAVIKRVTTAFHQTLGKDAVLDVTLWSTPDDIKQIRAYAHAR